VRETDRGRTGVQNSRLGHVDLRVGRLSGRLGMFLDRPTSTVDLVGNRDSIDGAKHTIPRMPATPAPRLCPHRIKSRRWIFSLLTHLGRMVLTYHNRDYCTTPPTLPDVLVFQCRP
jgi:hypothetical protein